MHRYWIISLLSLTLASCISIPGFGLESKKAKTEGRLKDVTSGLVERSKQLTTAVYETAVYKISNDEAAGVKTSRELQLIEMLAEEDVRIEGAPIEKIVIEPLLADLDQARKALATYHEQHTGWLFQKQGYENKIDTLNARIKAEKGNWLGNFFGWILGLGLPTIIVLVIVCVVFPPALPWIVGMVTSMFPKLIGLLGVAGKNVVDSLIMGVEEIKANLKDKECTSEKALRYVAEDTTYTKKEVCELVKHIKEDILDDMSATMSGHNDRKTKKVIAHRKLAHKKL